MRKNLSQSNIHDCGGNPPPRRRRIVDGRIVMEKLSASPSEKWVNAHGTICDIVLTDGPTIRNVENEPSAHRARQEQKDAGGILYGVCPFLDQNSRKYLPDSMSDDTPCAEGTFGEDGACKHVEGIIKRRQTEQTARTAKESARQKTFEQKRLEIESEHLDLAKKRDAERGTKGK